MIRIVVDTREQTPLPFPEDVATVRACLQAGDYSVEGFEDRIAVERKSLGDLVGSLTRGRRRFMRAAARLAALEFRAVVVESDLPSILRGSYRSRAHPSSILGSLVSLQLGRSGEDRVAGVPVVYAGDPHSAAVWTLRFLEKAVERIQAQEDGGRAA